MSKVLVVEDDQDIRRNMRQLLESDGYRVELAENGQEALTLLENTEELPDVIFLDLTMPVMDGFQFRSHQLQSPRLSSIPVIIMTADGRTDEKKAITTAAIALRKPANIDDILGAVESLCRRS